MDADEARTTASLVTAPKGLPLPDELLLRIFEHLSPELVYCDRETEGGRWGEMTFYEGDMLAHPVGAILLACRHFYLLARHLFWRSICVDDDIPSAQLRRLSLLLTGGGHDADDLDDDDDSMNGSRPFDEGYHPASEIRIIDLKGVDEPYADDSEAGTYEAACKLVLSVAKRAHTLAFSMRDYDFGAMDAIERCRAPLERIFVALYNKKEGADDHAFQVIAAHRDTLEMVSLDLRGTPCVTAVGYDEPGIGMLLQSCRKLHTLSVDLSAMRVPRPQIDPAAVVAPLRSLHLTDVSIQWLLLSLLPAVGETLERLDLLSVYDEDEIAFPAPAVSTGIPALRELYIDETEFDVLASSEVISDLAAHFNAPSLARIGVRLLTTPAAEGADQPAAECVRAADEVIATLSLLISANVWPCLTWVNLFLFWPSLDGGASGAHWQGTRHAVTMAPLRLIAAVRGIELVL